MSPHEGPPKGLEKHWPLVKVRDLAKLRNAKVRGFTNYLKRLDAQVDGKLLVKFGDKTSPLYANIRVLETLGPDAKRRDQEIKDLKIRVSELETKQRRCDLGWMRLNTAAK